MTIMKATGLGLGLAVLVLLYLIFLAGAADYPELDSAEVQKDQLFRVTEALLKDSESWPAELSAESVVVSSSLEPYPVRAVRYSVEVEAPFEKAIEYVKAENYSGPGRTDRPEKKKYEVVLYQNQDAPTEWVRRSVHFAPPPGGNRDAVVIHYEDRPDPKTYRIAFQSVESIDGNDFPTVEGAVRFKVLPSMYKVQETSPGTVRIIKVEAVDPRGSMSNLMNNHFISLVFFRSYMFEQAQDLRDTLLQAAG
jgi:hypothetical protein